MSGDNETIDQSIDSWIATRQQSKSFEQDKAIDAYVKDMKQGGSIRQGYPEDANENPPYGAVVGGMAAGAAGYALSGGNPVAAAVAAGAGAAGGQFVQGRIEMATKDKLAPRNFDDELFRMQREGAINLVTEFGGRTVAWLYPKVKGIASYAGQLNPEAVMAQQNMERMTGVHNPFFMPAEMTSSRVLDIMQNVAEYSLLGGGAIAEFKRDRDAFFTNMSRAIISRYGPAMSADDVGRAVVDSSRFNLEMAKHQSKFIYDAIESQAAPQYAKSPARIQVKKEMGKAEAAQPTKETEAFGESLVDFLRGKGGVKDTGGEIGRLEIGSKPGQKGLIKPNGMDLDAAAEAAQEAGYLQDRDVNALINAIESESRGKPVYSMSKGNEALQSDIYEQEFNAQFETKTIGQWMQDGEQLKRMRVMVAEQENQVGGTRIDLRPIKQELEDKIRIAKQAGGLSDKAMGNTLMSWIASKADIVSYPVAKAMRTEIRTMMDVIKAEGVKNASGIGKGKDLYAKFTDAIRKGLADDDPFLAQMWDEANFIEAGANQQFNTKFINELVKLGDMKGGNAPEAIVEKVWNPDRFTNLRIVRNAVSPLNWEKMQSIEMERLWRQAMPDGVPDSKKFKQAFFGEKDEKLKMMEAGFDRATVNELKDFYGALKLAQEKQSEGTGRVLVQLQQGRYGAEALGVVLNLAGIASDDKGLSVLGGAVILSPPLLAKLFTTPGGIRYMTEALTTSPKTAKGIALATNIVRILQGSIGRTQEVQPDPRSTIQQLQNVQ